MLQIIHKELYMAIGSWLRNHPRALVRAYRTTHKLFEALHPIIKRLGYERVERWITPGEELTKELVFDCRMCGQCILHSTGMTCPMTCPKNLRNGPCGGVRINGHCEVIPEMKCVWVEAFERSQRMPEYGKEILALQPPVNRRLEGSSAWINMLTGQDKIVPVGWVDASDIAVLSVLSTNHQNNQPKP
jgi:cell division inhibitor SulA